MTLELEVVELARAVARLREAWGEVVVTVTEDRPGDLAAAEGLCDTVVDGLGEISDAAAALEPGDARDLLLAAYRLRAVRDRYHRELRSPALRRALEPHGTPWRSWYQAVRAGLDHCEPRLCAADDAMLRCWREVLEAAPGTSVRVPTGR
jgi:hypothetical protein